MPAMLPSAEVIRKFIDEDFDSHTPISVLSWANEGPAQRLWELPMGFTLLGTPPRQFAVHIRRHSNDGYFVRVVWDQTHMSWPNISRAELLGGSLNPLLKTVGLDLWSMLEQPIPIVKFRPRAA